MRVIAKLEITVWHCPGKIIEKNRAHSRTRFARFARQLKFKVQSLMHLRPTMAWQKNKTKLLDKIFGIQKYICTSTSEGVDDTVWIHNRSVTVSKVVEI